nr:MAG TPA: hypothetical protein [Caudoviricetes sp.]
MKKVINKWQDLIWGKVIVPFADLFRIECEYCWWWRGVLVGSIITSVVFLLLGKLLELL